MDGWRAVTVLVALVTGTGGAAAQSLPDDGLFDPAQVVAGITLSRSQCRALEDRHTAVWVTAGGTAACLRYYAAGLAVDGGNPVAALWLHGDIMGPNPNQADKHQRGLGPAAMVGQERRLADRYGVPFVFLGRPGSYGSAGRHYTDRHRPREAALVDAAISTLSKRYRVGAWAVGGHSGGGTLAAEMLARRTDIRCAVISSGAAAFRAYLEARGLTKALATPAEWFDPLAALDAVPADPRRRVIVMGDPRDSNVPFATQTLYAEGLRARGHDVTLIPLERATDARHHGLVDWAEAATGLCAQGESSAAIAAALAAMPDPPPRISN